VRLRVLERGRDLSLLTQRRNPNNVQGGGTRWPVSLTVFKTAVSFLRGARDGFDSHVLPPHKRNLGVLISHP
jgi:hypothetical protein